MLITKRQLEKRTEKNMARIEKLRARQYYWRDRQWGRIEGEPEITHQEWRDNVYPLRDEEEKKIAENDDADERLKENRYWVNYGFDKFPTHSYRRCGMAICKVNSNCNHMKDEVFKDIPGYEGKYQVSNYGRVRNADGLFLRLQKDRKGYLRVQFWKDGGKKTFKVHRLVGQAFIDNPDNLPQINHIDEVKDNNYVGNLEWVNCSQNKFHSSSFRKIKDKVYQELLDGKPRHIIAQQYNTDRATMIKFFGTDKEFRDKHFITVPGKINTFQELKMKTLHEQGLDHIEIARLMNLNRSTVGRYLGIIERV